MSDFDDVMAQVGVLQAFGQAVDQEDDEPMAGVVRQQRLAQGARLREVVAGADGEGDVAPERRRPLAVFPGQGLTGVDPLFPGLLEEKGGRPADLRGSPVGPLLALSVIEVMPDRIGLGAEA